MRSFEIEVILLKNILNQTCILVTFNDVLTTSVRFNKSNRFCTFSRQSFGHRHLMLKCLAAIRV